MKRALLILSLVLPAAGCGAATQAAAPAGPEALQVPPVPPRVIAALPTVEPLEIQPVQNLPEEPPPEAPRRPPAKPPTQPPAQTKPDTPAETPPEPSPAPPLPAGPPLRPADSGDGPKAENEVRVIIRRTDEMLQSIDYRNLTKERQVNYDAAKNYIKQAEDTLKTGNVVLARSFAERAENYAKAVGGR